MKNRTSIIFILLGAVLMLSAFVLGVYYALEDSRAKEKAATVLAMVEQTAENAEYKPKDNRTFPAQAAGDVRLLVRLDEGEDEYGIIGVLTLEKLGIRLPVLSEYSMEKIKVSVCRYEADRFTQNGKMVIAGHNYKSHFGKLPQMVEGDVVYFTNINGEEYKFCVTEIIEIGGSDTYALEEGDWTLALLTCAFDQTKRIVVRCREV